MLLNLYTSILANLIVNRYFTNTRCLLIISDINNFNYNGEIPAVQIKLINNEIKPDLLFRYYGCQGIIISTLDPVNSFINLEKMVRFSMERFNQRRFLILPSSEKDVNEIFSTAEISYVSDLLVISSEARQIFNLITHKFVGKTHCNQPIILDHWFSGNKSFLFGRNLYPDKLNNQQGRPLKMATFTYEPYSIVGGHSVNEYYGSELTTAVQYGLKYNMTPTAVVNEEDYWGEVFANWSGNGLLGNLIYDRADIGFSALYTWEICYHYLDLSKPLVRTGITCLVPAPKLASGWLTPVFSYTPPLWTAVGAVFLTTIAILTIILLVYNKNKLLRQKYSKNVRVGALKLLGSSIMNVGKSFVSQSVTKLEMPVELGGKLLILLIFILSLFLTSTYSSGLSSIMTVPRYENPINTIEDFVKSGLRWGATQNAWITSIQNVKEPLYVKIVNKFTPTSEKNLREYSTKGEFAFALERLPHENFAVGSYIQDDIIQSYHLMEEDFYWEQCVIMTRKSSILLPSLDMFILRAFEGGFISVWQNQAVNLYMDSHVQKAVKYYSHHSKENSLVKLKWFHVQGAFGALLFGYLISFLVFLSEIYRKKHINSRL